MKGCEDYSADIRLYLDKELMGRDLREFLVHLEKCRTCKQELRSEEELSYLLHRSRPLYSAPTALRNRVMRTVAEPLPVSPRFRDRALKVLLQPLRTNGPHVRGWQALAVAVLLVAAGVLLLPKVLRRADATSYIEAAVAAHRSSLDGTSPLEVQSDSPNTVTGWFTGKVPFNFRLPSSGEASRPLPYYRLTGGRLVNYKNGPAALVAYQMKKEKISLLVVASSESVADAEGEEVRSGGLVFHFRTRHNFHIITWSNHGLTYALVSSLPGSGRQSCLVCHQDMTDSARFTAQR